MLRLCLFFLGYTIFGNYSSNQNHYMPKFILVLLLGIFVFSSSYAQDFNIRGKVVDSNTKTPLEAATIFAESIQDSTLIVYTISDDNGLFELEEKANLKEVNLFFSFNGYKTLLMKIPLKPLTDLGTVQLEEQVQELEGVNVIGERVPITIKKDTLEFNADSFKTRPDATVEDLLKRLPGVEVDSDGKITVNGIEVNQVLVNGQVFFSNDPQVATKSLPKEIVGKIQITDTKTKTQEFTGDDADGESKTINLIIKKDMNKGVLARITSGYGTDERYQSNGLLNYFDGSKRISLIASSNNINSAGFSFDEIYDMIGQTGSGISINRDGGFSVGGLNFGFGQGITTSSTIGTSYANAKKGEYEVDGNYFFAYSDSFNDEKTSRENILPNGSFFTDRESNFEGSTNSNRGSANLEFDIDKTLRIVLEPSMGVNRTNSFNISNTSSSTTDGGLLNTNETFRGDDGYNRNFSNRFEIIKKLDTLGTFIQAYFNNTNVTNESTATLSARSEIFGENPRTELLDQITNVETKRNEYRIGTRYRQALGHKMFIDVGYEYRNNNSNNIRSVFDYDDATDTYSVFNDLLSSDFDFETIENIPSLGFRHNGKKVRFNIRAKYQTSDLNNTDFLQNSAFSKIYKNMLWNGHMNYTLAKNKSLRVGFNMNLGLPAINQLQPIPNVSNPLNIITGNPNLEPSVSHRVYLNYNNYNWKERTGLMAYLGLNFQEDLVSRVTETDENFLRQTTYANIDGNYNHYGGIGYSKEIKKDSTLSVKLNIRPYFNLQKNVGFTNGQRLEARRNTYSPRITTNFNFNELIEIEPGYSLSFNSTKYNIDTFDDISFTSHNAELKTTAYWPKNIIWGNDIRYNYNGNVGADFDKDALFWNMSLGVQLFKQQTTLKVLAYDLLNQNINTRRSTGQDFIQDNQGTVLQRYFMLSFTYKFDQFGGKKSREGNRFAF